MIRRGKNKTKDVCLYFNNINGLRSKSDSMKLIIAKLQPNIVALCETKISKSSQGLLEETLNNKQYKIIHRYTKPGKEGIAVAVKHNTFKTVLDVTSTTLNTILAVRLSTGACNIRVILGYGPQEDDETELREEFFNEIELEIKMCTSAGDIPLLLGDFNARIIPSDKPSGSPTSENGRLMCQVLEEYDLTVLNFTDKCEGRWTHVIRTTGAKSVLDYVATDKKLGSEIRSMLIDESTIHCPFRTIQNKKGIVTKFSDHNAIIVNFKAPCVLKSPNEETVRWALKSEGCTKLEKSFNELCSHDMHKEGTAQEKYDSLENIINKGMKQCFKRQKIKEHNKNTFTIHKKYRTITKQITKLAAKGKTQRKVAQLYRDKILHMNIQTVAAINASKVQKAIQNLSENDKFCAQKFWQTKKSLGGKQQPCNSVITNDKEIFGKEEIINAYKDEFDCRLESVNIKPDLQNYRIKTEELCEQITKVALKTKQPSFTIKELQDVVTSLKKDKSSGPDKIPAEVFMYAGEMFNKYLLDVINTIKNEHQTPEQWENMNITTIYKGKGSRKNLVNQRGIFLTQVVTKIWEKLIMRRIHETTAKINKLQAGSRKNKSTADQVFLLRSCIAHAKYINDPLYVSFYDFRQCFDKLWLQDCIISYFKLGLHDEMLTLIQKTNEKATITVKTPLGDTVSFTKHSIVKQGSVTGSSLCSASVAEFCDEHNHGGVPIGEVKVSVLAYVDDIAAMNKNVQDVKNTHREVCFFADKKKLPLNETKCYLLPINCKQTDAIPLLEVNNIEIQVKSSVVYLGDIFNTKGDNSDLVADRMRKGTICIVNSLALCCDQTMGTYTIKTLLLLYKTVFLPTVLYNSETWSKLRKNEADQLVSIQMRFLKRILHVPKGTSNAVILLEMGVLPILDEIKIRKLNFLYHILTCEEDDPVKLVYVQQKLYTNEKNWCNEVSAISKELNLVEQEELITETSKNEWKSTVKERVTKNALTNLNSICTTQQKASLLPSYVSLKTQDYVNYLTPTKTRLIFQARSGVLDIKCNRPYLYDDKICRVCNKGDESIHHILMECEHVTKENNITLNVHTATTKKAIMEIAKRIQQFVALKDELKSK